ncbi:replication initiation O-like [Escherichia phage Min27]|uniref:Putative replication protein O n=1 Tax=Escherichia phage Min27 TaxID=489779 RepID=B0FEC8_9CAUD|nr:replication initiation O-like [Escherichia phage Min27]ABY49882.1 putative replication protein O [Escherichia phage Min27]
MSMNLMAKAMNIKVGNPLRKLVLIKLADNANDNGECWPSYQHVADQCEVSRSTVKSHIRALEEMGLLKREFRRKGELNQSNVFYLTLDNAQQIQPESGGAGAARGGAGAALGGGAGAAPRTYHSVEPVNEPKNIMSNMSEQSVKKLLTVTKKPTRHSRKYSGVQACGKPGRKTQLQHSEHSSGNGVKLPGGRQASLPRCWQKTLRAGSVSSSGSTGCYHRAT